MYNNSMHFQQIHKDIQCVETKNFTKIEHLAYQVVVEGDGKGLSDVQKHPGHHGH